MLKQYLLQVRVVRPYFDVTKDSPLAAFEREAPRHPVFQITTVEQPTRQERRMKETEKCQGDSGAEKPKECPARRRRKI